jgi:hypothetical protein
MRPKAAAGLTKCACITVVLFSFAEIAQTTGSAAEETTQQGTQGSSADRFLTYRGGDRTFGAASGQKSLVPVTDPEIIRQLNEQAKQEGQRSPTVWDQFPRAPQGHAQTNEEALADILDPLPRDIPTDLRARLRQCNQISTGDPREFLRCQDAMRDYDAFICQSHVRAETGTAYNQCRADLARQLAKLRAVQEIRCRRELDGSVLCGQ